MYDKNLTEDFRLRLSKSDMDFLRKLSEERSISVSETVRSLIGEYRRSLETMTLLSSALQFTKDIDSFKALMERGGQLSNGDTKTNLDN